MLNHRPSRSSGLLLLPMVALMSTLAIPSDALANKDTDKDTDTSASICETCEPMTPILESFRQPRGGEGGIQGVVFCEVINSVGEYDSFCTGQNIPDCPTLPSDFFVANTLSIVVIDSLTPQPCEGAADPTWSVECISVAGGEITPRVVLKQPGNQCICAFPPQRLIRLFVGTAVAKTNASECTACEEQVTINCLNLPATLSLGERRPLTPRGLR